LSSPEKLVFKLWCVRSNNYLDQIRLKFPMLWFRSIFEVLDIGALWLVNLKSMGVSEAGSAEAFSTARPP